MRVLLTTQSQNCYREQIHKEMLARLAWKSRYATLYPSSCSAPRRTPQPLQLPGLHGRGQGHTHNQGQGRGHTHIGGHPQAGAGLPPVTMAAEKQLDPPPPPPPVEPVDGAEEGAGLGAPPLMRPVSPQTRQALYRASSQQERGRSLYLQRRGQKRPEEKFDFPLLLSWEYGWRLGDHSVDYRPPARGRSAVVKNTFYSRNGVFSVPAASDTLG